MRFIFIVVHIFNFVFYIDRELVRW